MQKSEQINELATALAKAQGQFKPVNKSKVNPHLGNKYATLDDVIDAVRGPLSENGLSFVQLLHTENEKTYLDTMLLHTSGQYISSSVQVLSMTGNRAVNELQTLGGGLTYMKRYALSALFGLSADDDDDGNAPAKKETPKKQIATPPGPPATQLQREAIAEMITGGLGENDVNATLTKAHFPELEKLTQEQANSAIARLKKAVKDKDNAET